MTVLLNECVPHALKSFLLAHGHGCVTVQDAGWSGMKNGELLKLAESSFEAFLTLDMKLTYQQNLVGREIWILVVRAPSNRLELLRPHLPAIEAALNSSKPRQIVFVDASSFPA